MLSSLSDHSVLSEWRGSQEAGLQYPWSGHPCRPWVKSTHGSQVCCRAGGTGLNRVRGGGREVSSGRFDERFRLRCFLLKAFS